MSDIIQWAATAATILAASITAANLGARVTGWGFAVFLVGSLLWIATALTNGQSALLWTNIVLSALNLFGMWRWLGRQAKVEKGGEQAAKRSRSTPGADLFPVSLLSRGEVHADGAKYGHSVDAMASADGRIAYLIVTDGGVAGVGETLRQADWDQVKVERDRFVIAGNPERLPIVERDRWPAHSL